MKCKTCGETNLLKSDICGDHCIYCFGNKEIKKPNVTGKLICSKCGNETKVTHNDMCYSCYAEDRYGLAK